MKNTHEFPWVRVIGLHYSKPLIKYDFDNFPDSIFTCVPFRMKTTKPLTVNAHLNIDTKVHIAFTHHKEHRKEQLGGCWIR